MQNISKNPHSQNIKSRSRVRERGEVFTNAREVNNILALTQATSNRYWRFLEPACGNGNFLTAILRQRLDHLRQDPIEWHPRNREFSVLKILSTLYGVDIAPDNILECRARLSQIIFEYLPKNTSADFENSLNEILRTNFLVGDMINGKDQIFFIEYTTPIKGKFKRKVFALADMERGIEKPLQTYPMVSYLNLTPLPSNFTKSEKIYE